MSSPIVNAAYAVADTVRSALLAAWPRSEVRHELDRLREDGHIEGEMCEMAFSVWVADDAQVPEATRAVRAAGFGIDATQAKRGFLTVRGTVQLRPYALARAVTQLERAVAGQEAFVAVIGPTRTVNARPRDTGRDPSGSMVAVA